MTRYIEPIITVEAIRAAYPNPRTYDPNLDEGYCIGGAFMCYCSEFPLAFPDHTVLGLALHKVRPRRSLPRVIRTAFMITQCNDRGEFEQGWKLLGRFLSGK